MRLHSIRVRNFRSIESELYLEGFSEGLNVIAGDNEAGKSTLLAALRAAFFERYKLGGQAADAFLPFGSKVAPEVHVVFSVRGVRCEIRKRFCIKPSAELMIDSTHFEDDHAEDELEKLLRTEVPRRGHATAAQQGMWGLLWVSQASGFHDLVVPDRARSMIHTALRAELGNVVEGETAAVVIKRIEERFRELVDPRGNPKGSFKKARERVVARKKDLSDVEARLREHEALVDDLSRVREELRSTREARTAEQLAADLALVRTQRALITNLKRERDDAATRSRAATLEHQMAVKRRDERGKERQRVEELERDVEALRVRLGILSRKTEDAKSVEGAASAAYASSVRDCDALRERARALSFRLERARRDKERAMLQETIARAERAQRKHTELARLAEALTVDEGVISTLRIRHNALEHARIGLRTAAARLSLDLREGVSATVDGPVEGTFPQDFLLTEPRTITLSGIGSIHVSPGQGILDERKRSYQEAEDAVHSALRAAGCASLEEAERAFEQRSAALRELEREGLELRLLAPHGMDELRERLAACIADLPGVEAQQVLFEEETLDVLHKNVLRAEGDLEARTYALESARLAREHLQREWDLARGTLERAAAELERLSGAVREAQEHDPDARIAADVERLESAVEERTRELEALEARLAAEQPAELEEREKRLEEAIRNLKQHEEALAFEAARLEGALMGGAFFGLDERRTELEGALEREEAVLRQMETEAGAIGILHRLLAELRSESEQAFLAPIVERARPYLKLLIPNAELTLDRSLGLQGLRRGDREEPYHSLSVGTREQISIVTRLAFADLLRDSGQESIVILDDALAYSDERRLSAMKEVLQRASASTQILVLTCREQDYRDLGAPTLRLSQATARIRPAATASQRAEN